MQHRPTNYPVFPDGCTESLEPLQFRLVGEPVIPRELKFFLFIDHQQTAVPGIGDNQAPVLDYKRQRGASGNFIIAFG